MNTKLILAGCLLQSVVSFAGGFNPITTTINDPQGTDEDYTWVKDASPCSDIHFRTIPLEAMNPTCQLSFGPHIGCTVRQGTECWIYTIRPWNEMPWDVDRHEIKHAAGWSHEPK
jgi:hypothetical protein